MSIATFPKSVNGRVNTVPECGPPPAVEAEPHICRSSLICRHEQCIIKRIQRRQENVRKLSNHAGALQLAAILDSAERLGRELRRFMATHGPNHRCRLCKYLREEVDEIVGTEQWWEDLLILRANLESNTSLLMNATPGAITYELIRDEYEKGDE